MARFLSAVSHPRWVLFENRPALYLRNYIFITAHKLYNFGFRIKDTVYFFLLPIIMILIMKILLHNVYKIINLWYPTYVYQFFNFPYNYKNRVLACFQTRPSSRCWVRTGRLGAEVVHVRDVLGNRPWTLFGVIVLAKYKLFLSGNDGHKSCSSLSFKS